MPKSLKITPERCTGCMQCELACSFVQTGEFRPARSLIRVNIFDEEASYAPYTCFQCEEAWCMNSCPTNAIAINADTGAKVIIDQACVGCAVCTIACPFGTVFYNPDTKRAVKCNLCDGAPACATACPTNAIEFHEISAADWVAPWGEKVNAAHVEAFGA